MSWMRNESTNAKNDKAICVNVQYHGYASSGFNSCSNLNLDELLLSFSEERKASPEEMDLLQTKERTWRRRQQIKAFTALNDELVCIIYDPKKKKKHKMKMS